MTDFARRRQLMVDTQIRPAEVTRYTIIEAMLHVPREAFVPGGREEAAYVGHNLDVAPGRVILEPRTFAKMLGELRIRTDDLVLIVGANLGYSAAVVGRICEAVVAVEEDEDLAREAEANLAGQEVLNAAVVNAPNVDGAPQHGPYDAILIEGGVQVVPEALISQLKEGGRMAALFVEKQLGIVRIGYWIDGGMSWRFAFNAAAPVMPGFEKQEAFAL